MPQFIPVTGVTMSPTSATIEIGDTYTLTATVLPVDALLKNVSWSSSNEAVATVNASGVVTGVSSGTAVITVKTVDGEFTATCSIIVKETEDDNYWGCNAASYGYLAFVLIGVVKFILKKK
jgi:uncharacterized protein YjdB